MTNVWFVGNNGTRTISASDWLSVGIVAPTITWGPDNAWSIPDNIFTSQQLAILDADPEFLMGQTGPRTLPYFAGDGSNGLGSALAYYQATKDVYNKIDPLGLAQKFLGRGSRRGLPELFSSFQGLPNGSAPVKFDSGQGAWKTGPVIQQIFDGGLYSPWTTSTNQAGYYVGQLSGVGKNIGQRFRFKPNPAGGATTGGTAAMAITRTSIVNGIPTMVGKR